MYFKIHVTWQRRLFLFAHGTNCTTVKPLLSNYLFILFCNKHFNLPKEKHGWTWHHIQIRSYSPQICFVCLFPFHVSLGCVKISVLTVTWETTNRTDRNLQEQQQFIHYFVLTSSSSPHLCDLRLAGAEVSGCTVPSNLPEPLAQAAASVRFSFPFWGCLGLTRLIWSATVKAEAHLIDQEPDSVWVLDHFSSTPTRLWTIFSLCCPAKVEHLWVHKCVDSLRSLTRWTWWSEYRRVSFSPSPTSQFHPSPHQPLSSYLLTSVFTPSLLFSVLYSHLASLHFSLPLYSTSVRASRCHWETLR